MSSKIIAQLTKSIDTDIKRLEVSFAPALTGAVPPGFFTGKASEVLPIIAKCVSAKNLIPPAPGGLIKGSQFGFIEKKLKGFSTEYVTAPEPSTRATALAQIVQKVPGIIADYVVMKNELRKVKKALRV